MEHLERIEAARLLLRMMEALDEDQREVLVLAELEQMSMVAIGELLEVNVNGRVASVDKLAGNPRETALDARLVYGRLASDSSHFYWLEGNERTAALKRMAKTGGPAELLVSGLKAASSPSPVGDSVLVLSMGRVLAVPKTGGCARLLLAVDSYDIGAFTLDNDQLYFESVFRSDLRYSRVSRAPISGGTAAQLSFVGEPAGASGIAVAAGRVYWTVDRSVRALDL
jgi:hypothetical protein